MSTLWDIFLRCLPFIGFVVFTKVIITLIVASIKVRLNDNRNFKTYIKKVKISLTSIEVEFRPQSQSPSPNTPNDDNNSS